LNVELYRKNDSLEKINNELELANKQIKTLRGILATCSYCNNIRPDNIGPKEATSWLPIEKFIEQNSDAKFSHGICPDCLKEHFGEDIFTKVFNNLKAIDSMDLEVFKGKITGLVGPDGAGKTTLINLIPRFYDVTSGTIRVNGVDIRESSQEEVRSKIGFVPQKALLFSGTIAENIRFGKQDATQAEIEHAARIAQAEDFVSRMNDGYDAVISQGGSNLSGGQKQRLSIARALIRKPDIYIFDDSFSALDYKTDANLRAALKNETEQATVLIVAQRVSTVVDADQIIVLDNGALVGIGAPSEWTGRSLLLY